MLKIRKVEKADKDKILDMCNEFNNADDEILFEGVSNFKKLLEEDFEIWLSDIYNQEELEERGLSPQSVFVALNEDNIIVAQLI